MSSRRFKSIRLLGLLAGTTLALTSTAKAGPTKAVDQRPPNVIVILADDAGYADFGFHGSKEFATPHLDALARDGVVFDAAYATTPFCSPSRAGLLTGRYPQRFGYEFNLTHQAPPGVDARFMGLATEEKTLGDHFKAAGYSTIAIGKWHVGSQPQFHPNARGFDDFYGFLGGGSTYFADKVKGGALERNGQPAQPKDYLTDDFAREASAYIKANRDRPFLMYLAFNAVHTPMDARADDLAKAKDIVDPQRRRLAAMTVALDRAVGQVTEALRKSGMDRRTMVIFTNDNGGDRIGLDADNKPLRGGKGTLLEGGIRVPFILRYPDKRHAGTRRKDAISLMDILPTALSASGQKLPEGLDGRSLDQSSDAASGRALYWRYDNMAAVRQGKWKLLRFPDRPPQLYDLGADPAESVDLATREPERVRLMMQGLFEWEGKMQHPRWNTGTFWSQEDVRRYSDEHVEREIAKEKKALAREADG